MSFVDNSMDIFYGQYWRQSMLQIKFEEFTQLKVAKGIQD